MSRPTPITDRLEGILIRLQGVCGELRRGQTRSPLETVRDLSSDLEGIRLTLQRLAAHGRGERPRLADDKPDGPMTLRRLVERLDGIPPRRLDDEQKPRTARPRRRRPVVLQELPQGYRAAIVLGRDLYHLVDAEPFNNKGVCGAGIFTDSMTDSWTIPKPVCGNCVAGELATRAPGA